MTVLLACSLCPMCLSGAHGSQKRALDFLKLELQMFVSYDVDDRNEIWFLFKSNQFI